MLLDTLMRNAWIRNLSQYSDFTIDQDMLSSSRWLSLEPHPRTQILPVCRVQSWNGWPKSDWNSYGYASILRP